MNNKFYAGSDGILGSSVDGINWTTISTPPNINIRGFAYGSGKYLCIDGLFGEAMYSTNAIDWTAFNISAGSYWDDRRGSYYNSAIFQNNNFYVLNNKIILYSSDLVTWNAADLPTGIDWMGICYGSDKFVIVGRPTDGGAARIAYSYDAINWITRTLQTDNKAFQNIIYANNMFVATPYSPSPNEIISSYDGINWGKSVLSTSEFRNWIAFGDNRFVVLGSSSTNETNKVSYSNLL